MNITITERENKFYYIYLYMKKVPFYNLNIDGHKIDIWDDKYMILKHPPKCDFYEDDFCRNRIIKYLEDEGYLNLDNENSRLIVFDSYIVDSD